MSSKKAAKAADAPVRPDPTTKDAASSKEEDIDLPYSSRLEMGTVRRRPRRRPRRTPRLRSRRALHARPSRRALRPYRHTRRDAGASR